MATRLPACMPVWIWRAITEDIRLASVSSPVRRPKDMWWYIRAVMFVLACIPFVLMVLGVVQNNLGPDPARTLAQDTGRWTLRLMLASLAITPLRELLKLVGLAPLRRTLGLFALFYACVHFVVYILFLLEMRWSEIGSDILERPYITVGFVALLILVAMGVTSPKSMVRKMGRRWKPLHQLIYVAIILALMHLIWILRTDVFDAFLYGGIAAVLLGYRLFKHLSKKFSKALAR